MTAHIISTCYAYIGLYHLHEPVHADRITAMMHRAAGCALIILAMAYAMPTVGH